MATVPYAGILAALKSLDDVHLRGTTPGLSPLPLFFFSCFTLAFGRALMNHSSS